VEGSAAAERLKNTAIEEQCM